MAGQRLILPVVKADDSVCKLILYILSIGDGKVASIQVLDSGSFVYRGDSLLFTLYYRNSRGEKCTYRPVFGGSLLPYNPNKKL